MLGLRGAFSRDDGAPKMAEQRLRRSAPKSVAHEANVSDRVFVHDLVLDVEIGVYTHEKGVTQRVRFSVDVDLIPADALNDDIRQAFDYDTIIKGIKASSRAATSIWSRPWQMRSPRSASPILARNRRGS
jgi:Dihydroneopterin aldolase